MCFTRSRNDLGLFLRGNVQLKSSEPGINAPPGARTDLCKWCDILRFLLVLVRCGVIFLTFCGSDAVQFEFSKFFSGAGAVLRFQNFLVRSSGSSTNRFWCVNPLFERNGRRNRLNRKIYIYTGRQTESLIIPRVKLGKIIASASLNSLYDNWVLNRTIFSQWDTSQVQRIATKIQKHSHDQRFRLLFQFFWIPTTIIEFYKSENFNSCVVFRRFFA